MKKIIYLLFIFPSFTALSQGKYLQVLHKGDLFETEQPRMIVMDDRTFGQYYFYRVQFDSLRNQVTAFDHSFRRMDSLASLKFHTLQQMITEKDRQISTSHQAYLDMKATAKISMDETAHCVNQFNTLTTKYNRQTRRTKFWRTATIIFSGVTVIAIAL